MTTCAGTVANNNTPETLTRLNRYTVWEKTVTFACVAADTAATIAMPIDGILQKVIYVRPDTTNNDLTSTLTILDANDITIFTSEAALAENATSQYTINEPLQGTCDVTVTFNEAVGVSATFTVYLRGI